MARRKVKEDTICWNCANYCGGCSWTKSFKPVKGWTAIPHKLYGHGGVLQSYAVQECPKFIDDRPIDIPDFYPEREAPYVCPRCRGHVHYGDKLCGHCKSAFFDWSTIPDVNDNKTISERRVLVTVRKELIEELILKDYETIGQFANVTSLSYATVRQMTRVLGHTTLRSVQLVADALGVDVNDLIVSRWVPGMKE